MDVRTFKPVSRQVLMWLLLASLAPAAAQAPARDNLPIIEEVMVYAQKRLESAQDVPVAVTAMTGDDIRASGMQTMERLTELNPSVSFDTAQSWQFSSLKIRGIGTVGNTRSFEGAVGVFIDGVYRTRSGMALADLLDVNRLEVLRGPQTVLFGKNTVAGAIAAQTALPDPAGTDGYLDLRLGNYSSRYLTGMVNAPLTQTATLRVAGVYSQRDAFFTNPDNGDEFDAVDRYAVKAQFLYRPRANWDLRVLADIAKSDAPCCWGSAQVVNGPVTPLIQTYSELNGRSFIAAPTGENERIESANTQPGEKVDDAGIAIHVTGDLSDTLSYKSITSYRDWDHNQINADPDYVAADLFILDEPASIQTLSQEFNLSYRTDMTDLLLGLYFEREDYLSERSAQTGSDADNYLNALISADSGAVACLPPVISTDCLFPVGAGALLPDGEFTREVYKQDTTGLSVFAHLTRSISDKLSITGGLRYDAIDKDGGVDNQVWYDSAAVRATLATLGVPDDGTPRNGLDLTGTFYSPSFTDATRDREVTGTVSVQYFVSDDTMLYGGFSRGFKSGGVNLFREGRITNQTYAPEFANSLEAGLKSEYWGGRARTNVAIFDTRFTDLQINFFTGLEFRTENTGKASTRGVEIENRFQVTDLFGIDLSAVYLDATFDEIQSPVLSYLTGRDAPRAPRWSAVAAFDFERFVDSGAAVFLRGLASYSGRQFVGADVPGEQKVDSYVIADASVGMISADERWEASLWCHNCFDETYRTIYFNSTFQPGSFSAFLNDPRLYGVTFRHRF